jgi:hypothetical protein
MTAQVVPIIRARKTQAEKMAEAHVKVQKATSRPRLRRLLRSCACEADASDHPAGRGAQQDTPAGWPRRRQRSLLPDLLGPQGRPVVRHDGERTPYVHATRTAAYDKLLLLSAALGRRRASEPAA